MSDKLVVKVELTRVIEDPLVELTRVIEDPLVELTAYAEKEYKKGNTQNLRDFAGEEGINLDD